ncbi:SWIM zinc finger family protein [Streptomyces sp. MUM 136J]|uniref:SWIM zinc finger family protein n=1 Tax=Streptomyces sp. MUM 136J TaxID=2791992 RepID=UPI001F043A56|nr:SWIM zinc finger family protein [Streptomyces sp. MUM 136J]MCH0569077.1 SWIM zinc finger family protein [Streptomyces sp. MUM 136J]
MTQSPAARAASADPGAAVPLPPVAPDVVAAAVEGLTSRLRRKLDAAIERYTTVPVTLKDGILRIDCGADAEVTLEPGPSGAIGAAEQARCTCLLAPRCLHRAAVLGACPLAGPDTAGPDPEPCGAGEEAGSADGGAATPGTSTAEGRAPRPATRTAPAVTASADAAPAGAPPVPAAPTSAQMAAAAGLWAAAAAVLVPGIPAAGAVPQAELLRAAHTARLAGLVRAEAAALRVIRGLRAARAGHDGHRLADLTSALRDLLRTTDLLSSGHADPSLVGTVRRDYRPGGGLRVHGVFREPVISATGYGGVVTHLIGEDGRWFSVADVRPGGPSRARGAGTAAVALGGGALDHGQLARRGLLIAGATVSPDGRLGAGRGVRATPLPGLPWSSGAMGALFARPLAEAVAERLSAVPWEDPEAAERGAREPVGCDVVIVGAVGDQVFARALPPPETAPSGSPAGPASADAPPADSAVPPVGPLIRLVAASSHPGLAHTANLQQLASRPGLRLRVVGRVDTERAATLRPLAIGPVPGTRATLRLPRDRSEGADLGYDRLQGSHFPPPEALDPPPAVATGPDPLADSPLWQARHLVELAVAGGRGTVAEHARGGGRGALHAPGFARLRRAGFSTAADLAAALAGEAGRRDRDVFGRSTDPDPDRYARAWLAAAVHLAATERALVRATWQVSHPDGAAPCPT